MIMKAMMASRNIVLKTLNFTLRWLVFYYLCFQNLVIPIKSIHWFDLYRQNCCPVVIH